VDVSRKNRTTGSERGTPTYPIEFWNVAPTQFAPEKSTPVTFSPFKNNITVDRLAFVSVFHFL